MQVDVKNLAQKHRLNKWYICIWNPRILLKKKKP